MAGYHNYSKSNNAIAAENDGLITLKDALKYIRKYARNRHITSVEIADMRYDEWHHTSSYYKCTNYYLLETVAEYAYRNRRRLRAIKPKQELVIDNCAVEWLEWSGTRNHPTASKRTLDNVTVIIKGQTATIMTETPFKKRLKTNGFVIMKGSTWINSYPNYDDVKKTVEQLKEDNNG